MSVMKLRISWPHSSDKEARWYAFAHKVPTPLIHFIGINVYQMKKRIFQNEMCIKKRSPATQITQWSINVALDWWDQPLLRKQANNNDKIKQQ